jgi:uncharacterized membrane protein
MSLEKLFVEFMFYSFLGWIWETFYCTTKDRRFQSRGFLFGPICPIYGVGTLVVQLVFGYLPFFSFEKTPVWKIFLVCSIGSAILEYSTSYILEKKFHAMWWDYSNTPLNLNGRICLPASVGFGLVGVMCVRYVLPFFLRVHSYIPDIVNQFLALLLMGLLGADLALSVATLTSLLDKMAKMQQEFVERGEATFLTVANGVKGVANGVTSVAGGVASGVTSVAGGVASGVMGGLNMVKNTVKGSVSTAKEEIEQIRDEEEILQEKIKEQVEGNTLLQGLSLRKIVTFRPPKISGMPSISGVATRMKNLAKKAKWDRKSRKYKVEK